MQFCNDFDMNGPMLSGLAPPETMERLHKYQAMYDRREEEVPTSFFFFVITLQPRVE